MSEVNKSEEVKSETKNATKQPKGSFLKKVVILGVIILMVLPFTYYDMNTVKGKLFELYDYVMPTNSVETIETEVVNIPNEIDSIELRENLAQQLVVISEIEEVPQAQETSQVAETPETKNNQTLEISELKTRIGELEQAIANSNEKELMARLEKLEGHIAKMNRDKNNQGITFVILQLKMQIDSGLPYEKEIAILETMLMDNQSQLELISPLITTAQNGIPTIKTLAKEFKNLSAPEEIGKVIPENLTWYDNIFYKLRSFVSIRKIDESKSELSLLDAMDEAEALMSESDLAGAVSVLKPYKDSSEILNAWYGDAKARVDSEKIINELMQNAIVLFSSERLM